MSRPSNAVVDAYHERVYDRITLRVPKGCKEKIKALAAKSGKTMGKFINDLLADEFAKNDMEYRRYAEENDSNI